MELVIFNTMKATWKINFKTTGQSCCSKSKEILGAVFCVDSHSLLMYIFLTNDFTIPVTKTFCFILCSNYSKIFPLLSKNLYLKEKKKRSFFYVTITKYATQDLFTSSVTACLLCLEYRACMYRSPHLHSSNWVP